MTGNISSLSEYFAPKAVAQTIYINLERSVERRQRMEKMAEEIGMHNLERLVATDGYMLQGDEHADVLARTAMLEQLKEDGSRLSYRDFVYHDYKPMVPPLDIDIPQDMQKHALGIYGCQMSHLRAMKHALRNIRACDENKWTVILEDDAELSLKDRDIINNALNNAPENAGAIMLGGYHPLKRGMLPVTADKQSQSLELAVPTGALVATGIAYRPGMMRAMVEIYRKNLAMTREEGGIDSVDAVNLLIHNHLAGLPLYNDNSARKTLIEIFKKTSSSLKQKEFFVLNPSRIKESGQEGNIGKRSSGPDRRLRYGEPYRTFSKETAIAIKEIFQSNKERSVRDEIIRILEEAFSNKSTLSEKELIEEIENIANKN